MASRFSSSATQQDCRPSADESCLDRRHRPEADPALERLEVIADTFLSMNAPVQWALPAWLTARGAIQRQIQARTRANLAELDRLLTGAAGVDRLQVEGAGTPPPHSGAPADQDTVLALLEEGIWVHPGYFFGLPPSGWLVLSLLTPLAEFATGAQALLIIFKRTNLVILRLFRFKFNLKQLPSNCSFN